MGIQRKDHSLQKKASSPTGIHHNYKQQCLCNCSHCQKGETKVPQLQVKDSLLVGLFALGRVTLAVFWFVPDSITTSPCWKSLDSFCAKHCWILALQQPLTFNQFRLTHCAPLKCKAVEVLTVIKGMGNSQCFISGQGFHNRLNMSYSLGYDLSMCLSVLICICTCL